MGGGIEGGAQVVRARRWRVGRPLRGGGGAACGARESPVLRSAGYGRCAAGAAPRQRRRPPPSATELPGDTRESLLDLRLRPPAAADHGAGPALGVPRVLPPARRQ